MQKRTELSLESLAESLTKKKAHGEEKLNKVAAEQVRGRMRKVAFDVYNIENDPYDSLWKLEASDDGKEYLVRMDDGPAVEQKTGGWSALSNESGNSVTLAYKGVPIQRLSGKIFGFTGGDVSLFKRALLEKVAVNSNFRKMLIEMQPEEKKEELVRLFPELVTE